MIERKVSRVGDKLHSKNGVASELFRFIMQKDQPTVLQIIRTKNGINHKVIS